MYKDERKKKVVIEIDQRPEEHEASACVKKDSEKERKTRQSKKYVNEKTARKSIQPTTISKQKKQNITVSELESHRNK